ncbi:TetR/AcrR family transcriptional regulator [Streptomyces albus]|uniref:TetR/AcrR family transcriptional regulator n=1 Tax=Streptomyces albus TaxID=1888 RepID=UPI0004CC1F24|nr:TetR/AcrR family transcriptional regulator [Streptomyces albus]
MPRKPDTRLRAREEFAVLLLERGYLGVSLEEIAKTVGVKKASLYHHFPGGKAEIFTEVAHRYIDEAGEVLRTAMTAGETLRERLESVVATYALGTYNSTLGLRVYDATRHLDDATRTEISRRYVERLIAPMTALMADAVAAGELRKADPGFLATAFLELAGVAEPMPGDVAMPPEQRPEEAPVGETVRQVVALFLRGAAPDRDGG